MDARGSVPERGGLGMADEGADSIECPYCKESIKAGAVLCKHCGSRLGGEAPEHGGTCPYCKEEIHPEAIRCKHCGSNLTTGAKGDCGCGSGADAPSLARAMAASQMAPGRGVGYNPWCVENCEWQCGFAGGDRWTCWLICSWLCSFPRATGGYTAQSRF